MEHIKRLERIRSMVIWSFLGSIGSIAVVVFSFLLPSYQEQTDRMHAQEVIEGYEKVGKNLFQHQRYSEAEKVFERAFEFSENRRLDLEIMRLKSRIYRVYEQEEWKHVDFEDLESGDFLFLVETTNNPKEKSEYMGAYGIFLASTGKKKEAVEALEESIKLDPSNVINLINLGNAYDDFGDRKKAIETLEKALKQNPDSYIVLYNLGAIYLESNDCPQTKIYIERALKLRPDHKLREKFKPCL